MININKWNLIYRRNQPSVINTPYLDPDLLRAFAAVVDDRSFTRAADLLNRTQSAVSMQIKRLEDWLGAELFNRTKANVDLSAAGKVCSAMRGAFRAERRSGRRPALSARSKAWFGWA